MKIIYTTLTLLILILSFSTQLMGNTTEIDRLSKEIYITQEQAKLLMIRYHKEKEKSFNNRTVQSCITAMKGLREKEISLIKQKNNYIRVHNNKIIQDREQKKIARYKRRHIAQSMRKKSSRDISKLRGNIKVSIDLSQQKMFVYKGNNLLYTWLVSTARNGYVTPRGNYRPYHLEKMHYSKLYDNSPMPYSIFFKGGYAIHGTNSTKRLGRRASHGCVRLHPSNAKKLYQLVRSHGYKRTSIKIKS